MRKTCSIVFLCFALSSKGQNNLVLNGSFEDFSSCPDYYSQIDRAVSWFQPIDCSGTSFPWGGSTDYFNICSENSEINPPDVLWGSQIPKSGEAFSGIWVYIQNSIIREYVEGTLITPLLAGKEYYVEYYLSLAENSGFAIRNVGLYFSQDTLVYCSSSGDPIGLLPHIMPIEPVTDSMGWYKVSGFYTAQGGERFITIGNFQPNAETEKIAVKEDTINFYPSHYFIDDVYVGDYYEPHYPDSMVLYPNLNQGTFQLDYWLSEDDPANFYLYNSIGQLVEERRLLPPTGNLYVDLPYLAAGVYYWQVRRSGNVLSTGKMVVVK